MLICLSVTGCLTSAMPAPTPDQAAASAVPKDVTNVSWANPVTQAPWKFWYVNKEETQAVQLGLQSTIITGVLTNTVVWRGIPVQKQPVLIVPEDVDRCWIANLQIWNIFVEK